LRRGPLHAAGLERSRRKSRLSPAQTKLMSAEIAAGDFGQFN